MLRRTNEAKSCLKDRMKKDAAECAAVIFADLGIKPGKRNFRACHKLLDTYGGDHWYLPAEEMPKGVLGCCVRINDAHSRIFITQALPPKERCAVMIHELAHRLHGGQAYEHLNDVRFKDYPYKQFVELLALNVELLYLEAGGTGPNSKQQLRKWLS